MGSAWSFSIIILSSALVLELNCLSLSLLISSMGAPVMVELEGETDPLKIAMKELKLAGYVYTYMYVRELTVLMLPM